jgi:hypothetical protein
VELGGRRHVRRHRRADEAQIADHVGDAAIEEDRAGPGGERRVGVHLRRQHQLREERRVEPWQGPSRDRRLRLDDAPPGLVRDGETLAPQRLDERGLARAGPAGDDEEAVAVA